MKRLFFIACFLVFAMGLNAQSVAESLAGKIAQKMKDSLQLTEDQRVQLYNINMLLSQQKSNIRAQNPGGDSLRIKTQKIENKRDSLYGAILSGEKYMLYLQKKRTLVNNN